MKKILEGYREKGSKVIRSRGKNPHLLIIGEDHLLNTYVSPKDLFSEVKPEYFFCEGVQVGLEMSLIEYQAINVNQLTPTRKESFEALIQGALYDIGGGFAGKALTQWFPRSPNTTFVGMGIANLNSRSDQIVKASAEAVRELEGYVAE